MLERGSLLLLASFCHIGIFPLRGRDKAKALGSHPSLDIESHWRQALTGSLLVNDRARP